MPKFIVKKLIRDKILQRCLDDPAVETDYSILELEDFKKALIAKIHEEADEVWAENTKDDDVLSELADVQEVVDALVKSYGYTKKDVRDAQARKITKNGAFEERIFVTSFTITGESEWTDYFRANRDKYEEVK